ncbi:Bardet-Biedl syndrome 1 protein [Trichinella spiralis]|uniref:Bardet-Biedl syndrome 1 protein n=1 Tax=Trichinella spiralis TaxID=6334 RepID=A0A0V1AVR9_TRISP|nr:Bardet-Biedl syndrome 1 protein [Trichinella spiralis]
MMMPNSAKTANMGTYPDNPWWIDSCNDCVGVTVNVTTSSGIVLADLNADSDWKLVIADISPTFSDTRLKVITNNCVLLEERVNELVSSICAVQIDDSANQIPALAVAACDCILFYRNMKPFFRLPIPSQNISDLEQQIWHNSTNTSVESEIILKAMEYLRGQLPISQMSTLSQRYFALENHEERLQFIANHKDEPLKRPTVVTCMSKIKRSTVNQDGVDWLLVGTENGCVHAIDCKSFNIQWSVQLASTPSFIVAKGARDVDYKILISCRNSSVYTLKRDAKQTNVKLLFTLCTQVVGIVLVDRCVVIGKTDETLSFYTTSGKSIWTRQMQSNIITMNDMYYPPKNFEAVLVSLGNRTVHIYKEDALSNIINADDIIVGLRFGCFGREKGVLIMTTASGNLRVKLLRKNAKMNDKIPLERLAAIVDQQQRMPIPKKTKLFIEQTNRESEHYKAIHERCQRDLLELRLKTAETYMTMMEKRMNPVALNSKLAHHQPVNLAAQVVGFGPRFRLDIVLSTAVKCIFGLNISILYDTTIYDFEKNVLYVPFLLPNRQYKFSVYLNVSKDQSFSSEITLVIHESNSNQPIQTVCVMMPASDNIEI